MSKKYLRDLAERVLWTCAEAAAGLFVVELAGVQTWWAAPVAMIAAAVKGLAARRVGDKESAALGYVGRHAAQDETGAADTGVAIWIIAVGVVVLALVAVFGRP